MASKKKVVKHSGTLVPVDLSTLPDPAAAEINKVVEPPKVDAVAVKELIHNCATFAVANKLANELEEVKKDLRELVDLIALQFGEPFTSRAKEILASHSK